LGGNITNTNGANATVRGFEYSTSSGFSNGTGTNATDSGDFGNGTFTKALSGLTAGTTYYFKGKAQNTGGAGYGSQQSFTTICSAPATPSALVVNSSGFTASWAATTGAVSYRLDVATDSGFTSMLSGYSDLTVNSTSQAISGLSESTTYYVRIRAVNAGGTSTSSSTLIQATTSASTPTISPSTATLTGFSATAPSVGTAQSLTVNATNLSPASGSLTVNGATNYEVSTTSESAGFGSTASLNYSGSSISSGSPNVWIRLKAGLTAGNYNSETIAISGGGATTQNLTASGSVAQGTPTITLAPTATAITYGQTLADSTLSGGTASVAGTFAFTNNATAPNVGTSSQPVTFTPTDSANYTTANTTANVTVNKATPTLTLTSSNSTTVNGTVTLNATSASTGAVTYTSSDNSVVSIVGNVATGVSTGTATITASQAADPNYNATTATQTMTVTVAPVVILSENFANLTAGSITTPDTTEVTTNLTANFTTSVKAYSANGAVKLGSSSLIGSITSKTIDLSQGGGNFTVAFKVKGWTTVEGNITVSVTGLASQTVNYTALQSGNFETKTLNFTGGTANSTITFATTAKRAFLDDISVYYIPQASTPTPTAPAITSATTASATVGTAFSYTITASNNATSYGATGLPAGLTVNSTSGLISGTPTTAGNSSATITATNTGGTGNATLAFSIAKGTPTIGTPPTASAITAGQALSSSTLTGGVASVAGNFTFAYPTIVPGVSGNFSVTFTPSIVANYETVTLTVTVTVNPVVLSPLASWTGGNVSLTADLLPLYAIGGGSYNGTVASETPVLSTTGGNLTLTAIVRTDDPALTITGETVSALSDSWSTLGNGTASGDQTGVTTGLERRTFTTPADGTKKFLRLRAVYTQPN